MNDYLDESKLGLILNKIYPNQDFVHDKTVPNSELLTRPDYRCDNIKLIVEFDGDRHYREAKKIKTEKNKEIKYSEMGYKVVRIPYFVQMSNLIVKHLFEIDFDYKQHYPHGFISDKVILPADFCELGIKKFQADLEKFSYAKNDIIKSLKKKKDILLDKELVLPPSLFYLFD
jgi:hypothetical protein